VGPPGDALKDWHDFYMLVGTASATLVGLTFVAITIGAGTLTRRHEAGVHAFVTPTVVHFAAILAACLLILAPFGTQGSLGAALLLEGILGIAYSGWLVLFMRRHKLTKTVDFTDRVWYALAPAVGYLVLAAAAGALLANAAASLTLLATAQGIQLVAGIRNAWDMAVWITLRPPEKDE
jgi:hypothetical protein